MIPTPGRLTEQGWQRAIASHPLFAYCLLTFVISWIGAFLLVAHFVFRGEEVPKFSGLMMFPIMLLGPSLSSIFLTWTIQGSSGLLALFRRMRIWRCSGHWYAALLVPVFLILTTLRLFATFVSSVFKPNLFLPGLAFGCIAGFVEEIGWTGFAFPWLCRIRSTFTSAMILGLVWSAWHIPVIDYLGTATPHGRWWLEYFLAFSLAMTAIRVLISWLFVNTGSLLLAQMMHAASTGALVILSPPHVSAAQESLWYAVYGCLLWMVVVVVRLNNSPNLTRSSLKLDPRSIAPTL